MANGLLVVLCLGVLVAFDIADASFISVPGGGCESKCLAGCTGACNLDQFVQFSPCSYGCTVDGVYTYNMEPDLISCGTNKVCYQGQCRALRYVDRCRSLYGPNYIGLEDQYYTCSFTCIPTGGCGDMYIEDVPDGELCFISYTSEFGFCYAWSCLSPSGKQAPPFGGEAFATGSPGQASTPKGYVSLAQAILSSGGVTKLNPYGQVSNLLSFAPAVVGADPLPVAESQAVANSQGISALRSAGAGIVGGTAAAKAEAAAATRINARQGRSSGFSPGLSQTQGVGRGRITAGGPQNSNFPNGNGMTFGSSSASSSASASANAGSSNSFSGTSSRGGLQLGQPLPGFGTFPMMDLTGLGRGGFSSFGQGSAQSSADALGSTGRSSSSASAQTQAGGAAGAAAQAAAQSVSNNAASQAAAGASAGSSIGTIRK